MIREQAAKPPLFYSAEEIARAARSNFYLRLDAAVGNWQELARPFRRAFSADWGRPTDPVVYLKIFLVAYLENITYDTDLAERIRDSLAIREFLGYDLSEQTPDHSSISRNRARIGQCCDVDGVLAAVVGRCREQGLVGGEEAAVDASLIPANASLSSLRSLTTAKSVREHLQAVREKNAQAEAAGEAQGKPRVSNAEFRSASDPDARIAQKPGSPRDMYYKATHVTDGKCGIILAAECARADVADPVAAQPALAAAQQNLAAGGLSLGTVSADAGYDDADFQAGVEALGARPLTNYKPDSTKKPEGFRKAHFSYDEQSDCYRCPRGQPLRFQRVEGDRRRYGANPADCAACCQRKACLGSAGARLIYRHQHEQSRERNIARCHTEAGRQALRRRRHTVEPPFGHLKTYGGLGLINCRGRHKARVKVILAAVAWNLIKLVKAVEQSLRPALPGAQKVSMAAVAGLILAVSMAASRFRRHHFPYHPRRYALQTH